MESLGEVKAIYFGDEKTKKSASGEGFDMGNCIRVNLKPSLRRTKFTTLLIPWDRVVKVIVLE